MGVSPPQVAEKPRLQCEISSLNGEGQNRTADTTIFSRSGDASNLAESPADQADRPSSRVESEVRKFRSFLADSGIDPLLIAQITGSCAQPSRSRRESNGQSLDRGRGCDQRSRFVRAVRKRAPTSGALFLVVQSASLPRTLAFSTKRQCALTVVLLIEGQALASACARSRHRCERADR